MPSATQRSTPFDRDLGLPDLLKGLDQNKLETALRALLGAKATLLDAKGRPLPGGTAPGEGAARHPLRIELEPIAYLAAEADAAQARAAALLVEDLLRALARYYMASDLHLEAVSADYEKLQDKHKALMASERRYKELAAQLEERVREQVTTIESRQRQLYQAEKMASVGQLAAGVAHEINNPIGFIRSNLHTAREYLGALTARLQAAVRDTPPVGSKSSDRAELDSLIEDFNELLDDSVEGADRVARIVADLKGFSNVDRPEEEITDINEVIRRVCNVAGAQIQQRIDLNLGEIPPTRCYPGHLGQVFLGLLQNAAKAIGEGPGEICIHTRAQDGEILAFVTDTGCGIAEDVRDRIFDPFFTTHEVGEGTGLGLTVSRDIIRSHGGSIEVKSEPGSGTEFAIRLPVRE